MNMEIPQATVSWKCHSRELAAVCRNLLAYKFLVDCTLAAEGQRLTAHRLILSACSPYFRMLFSEGGEKHPIVFLKDVSFEMLKAVVDFVYRGETQIPKGHFEEFLALAQSLQIAGICNSFKSDGSENVSCSAEYYQNNTELQETSADPEDNSQNCCQQTQLHHSGSNTDAIQSLSSAVDEECLDSGDKDQGAWEFLPVHKPLFPLSSEELCVESEIPVNPEPSYLEFSKPKHEHVDYFEMEEKAHGNFMNEMGEGSNTDAALPPSSVEPEECLDPDDQVERGSTTLPLPDPEIPLRSEEQCLDSEITVKHEPLHFEVSELKYEHGDDVEMDDKAPEKLRNNMSEGTSPACSEDSNQYTNETKIFSRISDVEDARCLQADLHGLYNWCLANALELLMDKFFTISISRKKCVQSYYYTKDKTPFKSVDNV